MTEIKLRPITWHWLEWKTRHDALHKDIMQKAHGPANALRVIQAVEDWTRETGEWLKTLPPEKQDDVVSLLTAEGEMLWETADPSHEGSKYVPSEDERLDFRERYYCALPLLTFAERYDFPRVAAVRRLFNDLESWVTQKRGWLP
jgi:hypothetical protein